MLTRDTQTSEDTLIEELIEAGYTIENRIHRPSSPDGLSRATPSRTMQLDKRFIRLPWRLYVVVAPLPGKALAVYMSVWRESMLQKSSRVSLTTMALRPCCITRDEKALALTKLEQAGLIEVTRQRGKNPQITLLALVDRFPPTPMTT